MTKLWIKIDDLKVNLESIPGLLDRYNLLPDFLRRLLESKLTHEIKPEKKEQIEYFNSFLKEKNIQNKEALGQWLVENGLDDIHPSGGTRPRGGGWHYWKIWGGKPYSASPFTGGTGNGGSNYNWNGYSGYDYDFAIYIK